jgi:hypothetical protein
MSSEETGIADEATRGGTRGDREKGEASYRRVVTGKRSSESAGLLRKTPLFFSFISFPSSRELATPATRRRVATGCVAEMK